MRYPGYVHRPSCLRLALAAQPRSPRRAHVSVCNSAAGWRARQGARTARGRDAKYVAALFRGVEVSPLCGGSRTGRAGRQMQSWACGNACECAGGGKGQHILALAAAALHRRHDRRFSLGGDAQKEVTKEGGPSGRSERIFWGILAGFQPPFRLVSFCRNSKLNRSKSCAF